MGAFEFYLSFYGLLLGLSVAEVASGFLSALGARRKITIGWLTPALAIFVFLDITSFWIYIWGIRDSVVVNWATMFGGLFVALTYYISAGLIFPRDILEWPKLDDHYWRDKRLVLGGILLANLVTAVPTQIIHPPTLDASFIFGWVTYWPPLVVYWLSRSSKLDLVMVIVLLGGYLANVLLPSWILS